MERGFLARRSAAGAGVNEVSIGYGPPPRFAFVLRLSALGDVVMALRAVRSLAASGFEPVLVTSPAAAELARFQPQLNYILEWHEGQTKMLWEREGDGVWRRKELHASRFQPYLLDRGKNPIRFLLVDLQSTVRSRRAELHLRQLFKQARFTGSRIRKRTFGRAWLVFKARLVTTQRPREKSLPRTQDLPRVHTRQEDLVQALARREGRVTAPRSFAPWLAAPSQGNVRSLRPQVLLFLGGSAALKVWPATHFASLARLILSQSSCDVLLAGGHAEVEMASSLGLATERRVENLVGRASLSELVEAVARSCYVVTGDSIAAHLADAVGVPCGVLFGPTSPLFGFAPVGLGSEVLYANLNCSPCSRHGGAVCRFGNRLCLESMDAEAVFAAVRKHLK